MRRPQRIVAPSGQVLTVDSDLKVQMRVDGSAEDQLIASYLRAAVDLLDGYTGLLGRCILAQRWAFPVPLTGCELVLPFPDCRAMTVETHDGGAFLPANFAPVAGAEITEGFDRIEITGLPDDRSAVYVLLTAGWETPADVDENLKQAIRMLTAHWYENRETVVTGTISTALPFGVETLISPLRARKV